MCSLSWIEGEFGLSLAFSRDEQYNRPIAELPALFDREGTQVLSAIDPQGGGSWLAVNDVGIIVGLLNYYRHRKIDPAQDIDKDKIQSRGLLVNHLSSVRSLAQFERKLNNERLEFYAPFSLFFLGEGRAKLWTWDGKKLSKGLLPHFLSSSGYQPDLIEPRRAEHFLAVNPTTQAGQLQFHQNHFTMADLAGQLNTADQTDSRSAASEHSDCGNSDMEQEKQDYGNKAHGDRDESEITGPWSVCMHRHDAHSVSLSQITISKQSVGYRYWDGQPCSTEASALIKLPLSTKSFRHTVNASIS